MSLVQDPVFEKLINNTVELMVFRVRSLRLVEVGEREWGSFYSGDCYLVCDLRHGAAYIYYWIGGDSSQDEQAVVAIKAVELNFRFRQPLNWATPKDQTFMELSPPNLAFLDNN